MEATTSGFHELKNEKTTNIGENKGSMKKKEKTAFKGKESLKIEETTAASYWFVFCKTDLLLTQAEDGSCTIPYGPQPPVEIKPWTHIMSITPMADGTNVRAFRVDDPAEVSPKQFSEATQGHPLWCGLRASYYKVPMEFYLKAGKSQELLYWDANSRFCGVCGAPTRMDTVISKKCTVCGKEIWPQLSTAVIVLIHRGDEVLLVRAKNFKTDFYGLVAGFVETGETLEEAVHREVLEETGLTINHLQYFGSQPWPYPCGLMVGFYAEYVSGDIQLQKEELSKGAWFHHDRLPTIPEKLSIARKLIDHWLETFEDRDRSL